jgi:hypothetical protein
MLKNAHSLPVLKTVTIGVPAKIWIMPWINFTPIPESLSWDGLDAVIAQLIAVERLHIIYFGSDISTAPLEEQLAQVANRLLPKLPSCLARGIVTEDVVVDEYLDQW